MAEMRISTIFLLGLALLLAGCASSSRTKNVEEMEPERQVEWILAKDQRFSNELGRRQENGVPSEQAISIYVDSISAVDLSPLPEDVRIAFGDHRDAWKQYGEVLSGSGVDLASVANIGQAALRAEASGGWDISALLTLLREVQSEPQSQEGEETLSKIDETWSEVQTLASEYGATIEVSPFRYPDERLVSVEEVEVEQDNWDPNFGSIAAPDIRLSLRVDGAPTCLLEGKDGYVFAPKCTFLIRPSSIVEIQVLDDDIGQPDVIGTWEGYGEELLSLWSFEKVRRFAIKQQ
jgi:hypothetical protein